MITTNIEKEYVEGGVNITTTTVETIFTPNDVIQSRAEVFSQELKNVQDKVSSISDDINNLIPVSEPPTDSHIDFSDGVQDIPKQINT